MRYILALFFPFLVFFTIGKPFQGIICLILQITLIGWLPATIWAFFSVSSHNNQKAMDKKFDELKNHLDNK
ncbi:YqaE/Pmp3 family membrane protein [Helicobacter sp. 16-1353]|uniref:YqaE/Pmp3 family membrane protein n=1 Tax=Helicobacter sp. 16-1353 TaxID=2004996 RepID=UPI000DCCAE1E|nr:YqaE/Pmp3 family membrane protein [Helicobacter sp. 16-1353]RAX54261.1 YqaE/Pmp3 family membrane protein [Helicobacter sp. 16-1353]